LFLGAAYLGVAEPGKAIPPLKKYVSLQPADPSGHQDLGDALLATGALRDAEQEFLKLSQMDPSDRRAWYGLNRCYTSLAQETFQAVEKSAPESAYWLALVADERVVRRQFRSAFFFYRKAESLQPELRDLHVSIATVYRETGHKDWAETEQRKEQPLDSGNCAGELLACDFSAGHFGQVIREAEASPTPAANYWRSRAFARLASDAMARLEKLPEGSEIHELRAELLRARRQHLEAIKEWRLALRYAPHDAHLSEELLPSPYQARDYLAALALVDDLLRREPASAPLNFTKGDILLSSQETEKAIPSLEMALKADARLLPAHHALGRAYMLAGKPAAAIPHLQAALPIDQDGSLRYQLSRADQATGKADFAKKLSQIIKRCRRKIATRNRSSRKNCRSQRPERLRFRFSDFQRLIRLDVLQHLHNAARPADFDLVDLLDCAQSEVHAEVARRRVTHGRRHMVPLISDADARTNAIVIAAPAYQFHDEPVVHAGARVLPQFRGSDDDTTTSIFPSPLKSANAQPRCARAMSNPVPASRETLRNFPFPKLANTRLACLYGVASNRSILSLTCESAVKRSL
jgi:predicted Zn-dependent protease